MGREGREGDHGDDDDDDDDDDGDDDIDDDDDMIWHDMAWCHMIDVTIYILCYDVA